MVGERHGYDSANRKDWRKNPYGGALPMMLTDITIEPLSASDEEYVVNLIRRNLEGFDEAGTVLSATFRRTDDLMNAIHALSQLSYSPEFG